MLEWETKVQEGKIHVNNLRLAPDLRQEIGAAQGKDDEYQKFNGKMLNKEEFDLREGKNEVLYFRDRICVPGNKTLRKQILVGHTSIDTQFTRVSSRCTKI
jgi:hypothetical protein